MGFLYLKTCKLFSVENIKNKKKNKKRDKQEKNITILKLWISQLKAVGTRNKTYWLLNPWDELDSYTSSSHVHFSNSRLDSQALPIEYFE